MGESHKYSLKMIKHPKLLLLLLLPSTLYCHSNITFSPLSLSLSVTHTHTHTHTHNNNLSSPDKQKGREKKRGCKKLTLLIMEAEQSQGPQSELVSWGPRGADGVVPALIWRLENQENSRSLRTSRLETQEKLIFLFKPKERKRQCLNLKAVR